MLDRQLARHGQDVVLQRQIGLNQAWIPVGVRAQVIGFQPHELIVGSGIQQGDSKVIISPTQIDDAQWPGGTVNPIGDIRIPVKADRMVIGGRTRAVQAAAARYIAGELVRIEVQVR